MNIVLLSGGSGKRLWPISNDIRSKQFIKFFKDNNGKYESMVQRVYRQIKSVDENANITIATSKKQVSAIRNQLAKNVNICVEPARRDTFPAIALACAYLKDKQNVKHNDTVIVCPVDPYVDENFFKSVYELSKTTDDGKYNLNLIGAEPTYPSEKYGYIIPQTDTKFSKVSQFKEKPNEEKAKEYINQGALWNCGVFAFKLGYILDIAHKVIDFIGYEDLYDKYDSLKKISFDYAVVEKESSIRVMKYSGSWKDIGTWNTLCEEMYTNSIGNSIISDGSNNTHVINELDIPILCVGCDDLIVAASNDGILVSDKKQSSYIKSYVDKFDADVRYAEKSWGSFKIIDVGENSLTIKINLLPKHKLNYHSHECRDEVWTVISGTGESIIDGKREKISTGDIIKLPVGCKHTVIAETELTIIEVQLGEDISVEDKKKHKI